MGIRHNDYEISEFLVTLGCERSRPVILEAAMIAAQPFFHSQSRLVGAGIGIGRAGFGIQRDLGVEVNGAFGAKA